MSESSPPAVASQAPAGGSMLLLPLAFSLLLAAFAGLPLVRDNRGALWSFLGTAAVLAAWTAVLWLRVRSAGRTLKAHWVLRRPHWLQPLVQGSVYLYWATRWPEVLHSAPLIVGQLVFVYAFDMLLAWSVIDDYELGMGPFPIIFSVNLFMWFKPDWFWAQFIMVASGFAAKRFVRWKKDGQSAHIFNPSSLPLALVSVFLLATHATDLTLGKEIAQTLGEPSYMFQFLFLVSIPGQILFGVASMTMPAVLTAALLGAAYFGATGTYFFFGPIPTAAFLGMLLLFTDPSTAPKTELGRVLYGIGYGASVFVAYGLLDLFGQPLHYDKLLFVPFLNLGVRAFDRLGRHFVEAKWSPDHLLPALTGRKRNAAWFAAWTAVFAFCFAINAIGDIHPGNRLPFWQKACAEGLHNGCRNLQSMQRTLCEGGSPWACNEYGIRLLQPGHSAADAAKATQVFEGACEHGMRAACENRQIGQADPFALRRQDPDLEEYQLLIDNRLLPTERTGLQEMQWACEQGWESACAIARQAEHAAPATPHAWAP